MNLVFTTPVGGLVLRQAVAKVVEQAAKTAGITAQLGTHAGRRTVVITLFVDGAEALKDIPRVVGHAKPSTTAGYVRRPEPTVREMLLDRVDELVDRMARELEDARTVTEHLHPQRARSCRNAITMASVMTDEIRLRAHAPTRRARALRRMYLRPWGSDNA